MQLDPITPRYFKQEWENAFEGGVWNGHIYQKWNRHLQDLADEGEFYLEESTPEPNDYRNL